MARNAGGIALVDKSTAQLTTGVSTETASLILNESGEYVLGSVPEPQWQSFDVNRKTYVLVASEFRKLQDALRKFPDCDPRAERSVASAAINLLHPFRDTYGCGVLVLMYNVLARNKSDGSLIKDFSDSETEVTVNICDKAARLLGAMMALPLFVRGECATANRRKAAAAELLLNLEPWSCHFETLATPEEYSHVPRDISNAFLYVRQAFGQAHHIRDEVMLCDGTPEEVRRVSKHIAEIVFHFGDDVQAAEVILKHPVLTELRLVSNGVCAHAVALRNARRVLDVIIITKISGRDLRADTDVLVDHFNWLKMMLDEMEGGTFSHVHEMMECERDKAMANRAFTSCSLFHPPHEHLQTFTAPAAPAALQFGQGLSAVAPRPSPVNDDASNDASSIGPRTLGSLVTAAPGGGCGLIVKLLWNNRHGVSVDTLVEEVWAKEERRGKTGDYEPPTNEAIDKRLKRINTRWLEKSITDTSISINWPSRWVWLEPHPDKKGDK